jgi:iron complex outermembrane receptor protein
MRTLTLLNGRRLAKEPLTSQYVSVSVMPRMAMARTDILRDGASSAYGSDAIAGVQAFYTHRSFKGFEIKAEALVPERKGGGDYQSLGLVAGFGDLSSQGWNVYVAAEMQKRKILLREERPELIDGSALNAMGISTAPAQGANATPANFTDPTHPTAAQRTVRRNPYFATGCLPPFSQPSTASSRQTCWLDQNDTYSAFGNGNDITTVYGRGTLSLGSAHTLSAEYNYAQYMVLQNNLATPVTVRLKLAQSLAEVPKKRGAGTDREVLGRRLEALSLLVRDLGVVAAPATGAAGVKTTVLLTPEEIDEAAKKTGKYVPPGQ